MGLRLILFLLVANFVLTGMDIGSLIECQGMTLLGRKPMNVIGRTAARGISLFLVMTLLIPNIAFAAPKPLTENQVHSRLLKRGLGNWVGVEMQDGTAFVGRIVSIDDQTFSMQLHNDPQVTPIFYSQVSCLQTGPPRGLIVGIAVAGIGAVVAMAAVGFHEVNEHDKFPTAATR